MTPLPHKLWAKRTFSLLEILLILRLHREFLGCLSLFQSLSPVIQGLFLCNREQLSSRSFLRESPYFVSFCGPASSIRGKTDAGVLLLSRLPSCMEPYYSSFLPSARNFHLYKTFRLLSLIFLPHCQRHKTVQCNRVLAKCLISGDFHWLRALSYISVLQLFSS